MTLGPLDRLIGVWTGAEGLDIAPAPDGEERNPYHERIVFEPVGEVENAERQHLVAVRYVQIVRRRSNDEVFHDQTGYWMWDEENSTLMHSIAIPRGLCLIAGGELSEDERRADPLVLRVRAASDDPRWGIVQSPFLAEHARTIRFSMRLEVHDSRLVFSETTTVEIYGRTFEHRDENVLLRVDS